MVINSWHPASYRSHQNPLPIGLALPLTIFSIAMRTLGELRRSPTKDWWSVMRRKCGKVLSLLQRPTGEELRRRQIKRIEQAMFHAVARYTIRPYPGRVLNIVAAERVTAQDTRYAWNELAEGGCQTVKIAARRTVELVASPHVEEVSSHIRHYIDENCSYTPVRPNNRAA